MYGVIAVSMIIIFFGSAIVAAILLDTSNPSAHHRDEHDPFYADYDDR